MTLHDFQPQTPAKIGLENPDSFFLLPLGIFDEQFWNYIKDSSVSECSETVEIAFMDFLKGCYNMYTSLTNKSEDTLHYFKNIHLTYNSLKNKLFKEYNNNIVHYYTGKVISEYGDDIQKITAMHHFYINQFIYALEKIYIIRSSDDQIPNSSTSGFKVKNPGCLNDAYNQLINLQIIEKNITCSEFRRIFSDWNPAKKITWLQGPMLLYYFIHEINGVGIFKDNKVWNTTIKCFQNKGGGKFKKSSLKGGKYPKDAKKIEDITYVIQTINEGFSKVQ